MEGWFATAAGVIAALLLLSLLLPENSKLQGSIRILFSLLLLSVLLSPLFSGEGLPAFPDLPNGTVEENPGDAWQKDVLRSAYEAGAREAISLEFSLDESEFTLSFIYGEEALPPVRGKITLHKNGIFVRLRELKAYLTKNFCSEFEVEIDVGEH